MNTQGKRSLILSLLIGSLISGSIAGCVAPKDDLQTAQKLSEVLGVPVFLWASSDDVCGIQQFHGLVGEFNATSDAERTILLGEAKRYDSIVFNGSQLLSPLTGTYYRIQMYSAGTVKEDNTVEDTRNFQAIGLAGTSVTRGEHLMINPQSAPDQSVTKIYRTQDEELFQLIMQGGPAYLEDAAVVGRLQDVTPDRGASPFNCGKQIHLKDLLGASPRA